MNLNLLGVINDRSYGLVCLNLLNSLSKIGTRTSFFPVVGPISAPEQYREVIQNAIDNQEDFDPSAPSVRIWHAHGLAEHVGRGKHVGFTIFELDRFSDRELNHLRSQDQVITCSHWGQRILSINGIKSDVVPLGIDPSIFSPANTPRTPGPTVFAHYGKWELRKGIDVLQVAFNRAFGKSDNVKLRLHCWNPFLIKYDHNGHVVSDENKTWENYFKKSKLGDKIEIAPWLPTQYDIAESMRAADVGVFPTRAEGWNLELLEMMACGKRVITTNNTGHTEYVKHIENSLLIETPNQEVACDGVFFNGQGNWAEFEEEQIDQLAEYMRAEHIMIQNVDPNYINVGGIETARKFTWDNAAKKLLEVLQ